MDLAATSSTASNVESPAIEKAREKQRRKISEAITGLKQTDQIEFLISRLAEAEVASAEQKKETDQLKRDTGRLNTVFLRVFIILIFLFLRNWMPPRNC